MCAWFTLTEINHKTFRLMLYRVTLINKIQATSIHSYPVDIMLPPSSLQVHLCYQFGAREVTKFSYPNATGETAGWGVTRQLMATRKAT